MIRDLLAVLAIVALVSLAILWQLNLPVVQYHYWTHKCVRVTSATPSNYSCKNLPSKFETEWVMK